MDSGGGAARAPKKHLARGAVDYVCLLSKDGDEFPETGHIGEGDGDTRNWRRPNNKTDFAAWAGQAEKEVLRALEFNLLLHDKEIGLLEITVPDGAQPGDRVRFTWPRDSCHNRVVVVPDGKEAGKQFMTDVPLPSESFAEQNDSQMLAETGDTLHGLDGRGFLTEDALRALDIHSYLDLWGKNGKVVEKARELLLSKAHSTAARDQVRKAHCELEQAVYFRQLDVMNYRFSTRGQYDGKTRRQIYKEALLTRSKEEILKEYDGDCRDRMLIRDGKLAEIPWEQQAEAEAVQVAITPAAEPYAADSYDMDVKYCTLLKKSCK